jgi:hypothetical protein
MSLFVRDKADLLRITSIPLMLALMGDSTCFLTNMPEFLWGHPVRDALPRRLSKIIKKFE